MNRMILGGNISLGNKDECEVRYTAGNSPVVNFNLPASYWDGKAEQTSWIACSIYGPRALKLAPHLKKGVACTVVGELTVRNEKRTDGNGFYFEPKLVVQDFFFDPSSENHLVVTGALGKDAEAGKTSGGTSYLRGTLAIRSGFGDNEKTSWISFTLFGKRAESEAIRERLKKGALLTLSGEYATDEYTNSQGEKVRRAVLRVEKIDFAKKSKNANQKVDSPSAAKMAPGEIPECPFEQA